MADTKYKLRYLPLFYVERQHLADLSFVFLFIGIDEKIKV